MKHASTAMPNCVSRRSVLLKRPVTTDMTGHTYYSVATYRSIPVLQQQSYIQPIHLGIVGLWYLSDVPKI